MRVFVYPQDGGTPKRVFHDVTRIARVHGYIEVWAGYRRFLGAFPESVPWQAVVPYCGNCIYTGQPSEGLCYCCRYAAKVDGSDS